MNNKKIKKAQDFQIYLKRQLKNPEIKKYYDEYGKQLEIAYQILKLRKSKKFFKPNWLKNLAQNKAI